MRIAVLSQVCHQRPRRGVRLHFPPFVRELVRIIGRNGLLKKLCIFFAAGLDPGAAVFPVVCAQLFMKQLHGDLIGLRVLVAGTHSLKDVIIPWQIPYDVVLDPVRVFIPRPGSHQFRVVGQSGQVPFRIGNQRVEPPGAPFQFAVQMV